MTNNQLPESLYYTEVSTDALNLSNYVDQVFKQAPVETVNIPLLTQTNVEIQLENKINTDANNLTTTGQENIQALNFPGDNYIDISSKVTDITAVGDSYKTLLYTADQAGWVFIHILNSTTNDFITLYNESNTMQSTSINSTGTAHLYAKLPISKYQIIDIIYESNNASSAISYKFIPAGTQPNLGETLINTRDYKNLMAGISFPDISRAESFTLQSSGSQTYIDRPGYFSFIGSLVSGNYFSMFTDYTGVDISYDNSARTRRCLLPVSVGSIVTFEYNLSSTYNFYFIPAIGTKEV